jgi:hypothetical protein
MLGDSVMPASPDNGMVWMEDRPNLLAMSIESVKASNQVSFVWVITSHAMPVYMH